MNWGRAFFGLLIVAVGALLLLSNLGVIDDAGQILSDWWPAVIVAGGIISFVANPRHWLVPLLLVGVGTVVLLTTTGVMDGADVIWPALIILAGLLVLFGRGMGPHETSSDERINTFNIFSGTTFKSDSTRFEGGRISAVFGGAEVDLRQATLSPGASIDIFTAFGGVEISVPNGWRVDINGFPVFGGFENATSKENLAPDAPRLNIDATLLFGGLEVKH